MYSQIAEKITHGIGTFECKKFRRSKLSRFDLKNQEYLSREYRRIAEQKTYVEANQYLLSTDKFILYDLDLTGDSDYIKLFAERMSNDCARTISEFPGDWERLLEIKLRRYGLEMPDADLIDGVSSRLKCHHWWRRQVRVLQGRTIEKIKRAQGIVNAHGQIYCSSFSVARHRRTKKQNKVLMQGLSVRNQYGDEYTLDELSALSVSNPYVRRSELMVRMRGFEEFANNAGHIGVFITMTCPSRFHVFSSKKNKNGKRFYYANKKYDQSLTVQDCQNYLNHTWQLIRSALRHAKIQTYGFRVAEPHHDGTPHWHLLLFIPKDQRNLLQKIFIRHCLSDSPDEPGARKSRLKIVRIDKRKGSATGYIAKYIAKAIDGDFKEKGEPGADLYGRDAVESAQRIQAWSGVHGIRQFQQIGGPPVGVWRELRRLADDCPPELCAFVDAASASDWAAYCYLMGGMHCKRDDRPISVLLWEEFDPGTGEIFTGVINRYGEPVTGRTIGLLYNGEPYQTRFYTWELVSGGANAPPWSTINNCARA